MRLLPLLLCALLPLFAHAQTPISGRVVDADSGAPIPYATIAIKGKSIGMISDGEGRFEIQGGENISTADSVVVSHVGFEAEVRTVGDLTGVGQEITLRKGVYEIERIVVTNRKSRVAKLGHSSGGTGMFQAGWFNERGFGNSTVENHEGGTAIKIKNDSEILSFAMMIRQNGYERALLRLSFYSLENNTPGELIVHRDIRFEVKDRFKGRFEVDLAPYDIRLAGGQEVLVTLTLLEDEMNSEKPEKFMLDGALLGKGVYSRIVGNESWARFGSATITMYLNARVYK